MVQQQAQKQSQLSELVQQQQQALHAAQQQTATAAVSRQMEEVGEEGSGGGAATEEQLAVQRELEGLTEGLIEQVCFCACSHETRTPTHTHPRKCAHIHTVSRFLGFCPPTSLFLMSLAKFTQA